MKKGSASRVLESKHIVLLQITMENVQRAIETGEVQTLTDGGYFLRNLRLDKDQPAESGLEVRVIETYLTTDIKPVVGPILDTQSQSVSDEGPLFTWYSIADDPTRAKAQKIAVMNSYMRDQAVADTDVMYVSEPESLVLLAWLCRVTDERADWTRGVSLRVHKTNAILDGMYFVGKSASPLIESRS